MSATATTQDNKPDSRTAGRYVVVLTERNVAGQQWWHVALTLPAPFGAEGLEVGEGWVADHTDLDRARSEANRAVCVFRSGRTVEDAELEYAAAAAIVAQEDYTYRNVSAHDIAVARATMDLFQTLAQRKRLDELVCPLRRGSLKPENDGGEQQ